METTTSPILIRTAEGLVPYDEKIHGHLQHWAAAGMVQGDLPSIMQIVLRQSTNPTPTPSVRPNAWVLPSTIIGAGTLLTSVFMLVNADVYDTVEMSWQAFQIMGVSVFVALITYAILR